MTMVFMVTSMTKFMRNKVSNVAETLYSSISIQLCHAHKKLES